MGEGQGGSPVRATSPEIWTAAASPGPAGGDSPATKMPPQEDLSKLSKKERDELIKRQKQEDFERKRAEMSRKNEKRKTDRALLYNRLDDRDAVADGRGIHCMNLILYLWAKNTHGNSCPLIKLPDTVLIQNGRDVQPALVIGRKGLTTITTIP